MSYKIHYTIYMFATEQKHSLHDFVNLLSVNCDFQINQSKHNLAYLGKI